jgi:hypothetical protein
MNEFLKIDANVPDEIKSPLISYWVVIAVF